MATKPHHKAVLSALAAPERLKVFAAVVLGRGTAVEIAQETGIVRAKIERALGRLVREGMIGKDRGRYGVIEGAFGEALARSAGESGTLSDDPRVDAELRKFFKDGRLVSIPARRNKRLLVLDHISSMFEPGRYYPERQVNAVVREFHSDYASLRRYLVDEGFLRRGRKSVLAIWREFHGLGVTTWPTRSGTSLR